jgi:hypothetical protein
MHVVGLAFNGVVNVPLCHTIAAASCCCCCCCCRKSSGFPHGVFPVSELLCISLMLKVWPSLKVYSIAASSVFKVPVWRHIMCWTGEAAGRLWSDIIHSIEINDAFAVAIPC